MRLTLPEPYIPEKGGFTSENDIFRYREFGERLVNLVSNINEPLTIALDGPWGSGKSVFIKQWAGLIRERGGNVVYFDAFENDFHEDAFSALSSQIYSLAQEKLDKKSKTTKVFLDMAKKVSKAFAPMGLRVAMHAGSFGLLSSEYVKAGEEAIKSIIKELGNETEKIFENTISEKLQKAKEERALLEDFRKSLEDVSQAITKKEQTEDHRVLPLIFIVDDLDRCRPPFAIEVIERIKHLFSVEKICFVLVTNLTHLESSIRGAYGTELDAHIYLEKFYQLKIVLPEPDFEVQNQRDRYLMHLRNNLQLKFGGEQPLEVVFEEINYLANAHALTLRQIEHVMRNVVLLAASSIEKQTPNLPVTAGLCIMRQTHPKLYALARENNLPWKKVEEFLKIDKNNHRNIDIINGWRYLADPDAPEQVTKQFTLWWDRSFLRLNLPQHRHLLQRAFTNDIDSLLGSQVHE